MIEGFWACGLVLPVFTRIVLNCVEVPYLGMGTTKVL